MTIGIKDLPKEIQILIGDFDNTKYHLLDKCLHDLKIRHRQWKKTKEACQQLMILNNFSEDINNWSYGWTFSHSAFVHKYYNNPEKWILKSLKIKNVSFWT